jgi:hypothetical protein
MSPIARDQISPEDQQGIEQQKSLETWAADRVKAWADLQENDYDFCSWAKGASRQLLQAGAVYEYARESRKLRCLLALMNPKRPRKAWEIELPGMIDGKTPTADEIASYPAQAFWMSCSFKGLEIHHAERALGGSLYCLCDLADYLADNISFGELFRTKREDLEKAFGGLDELERVKTEFRCFLPYEDAVQMATRSGAEQATVLESVSDDKERIICGEACSEVIAVRIHWRFTDSEIVTALKRFLDAHRPRSEAYKARQRKKGSRRNSVQSALDCLSAMRLASYLPKTIPPPTPGKFAAWQSGASPELKQSAIEVFDRVRLGGRGKPMAESNFDALIIEGRKAFTKSFPFEEDASNAPTLTERVMMKSERISSQDKT